MGSLVPPATSVTTQYRKAPAGNRVEHGDRSPTVSSNTWPAPHFRVPTPPSPPSSKKPRLMVGHSGKLRPKRLCSESASRCRGPQCLKVWYQSQCQCGRLQLRVSLGLPQGWGGHSLWETWPGSHCPRKRWCVDRTGWRKERRVKGVEWQHLRWSGVCVRRVMSTVGLRRAEGSLSQAHTSLLGAPALAAQTWAQKLENQGLVLSTGPVHRA